MKIKFIFILSILFLTLQPATGRAFVPQTPHLLQLVVQKIKHPAGIQTFQKKTIVDRKSPEEKGILFQEELIYKYPDQLRSEAKSETMTSLSVESEYKFIKVINGEIVSRDKSPIDLYTDILLYRNHESLLGQMVLAGIDVTKVGFKRYKDTICYVIGQPGEKGQPFAGLWIEKDTFFPVKYAVKKNDWIVEYLYLNWQKISRTWYPMQIDILLDNQLFATIEVNNIALESDFSPSIFDISHIEQLYPEKQGPHDFNQGSKKHDELDKRIEEFKKLYE
ncbi:MAG: hypothetical protein ABIJ59_05575 [Pseudomonadota bacterium]